MNVLKAADLHGEPEVDAYDVVDILGVLEYRAGVYTISKPAGG